MRFRRRRPQCGHPARKNELPDHPTKRTIAASPRRDCAAGPIVRQSLQRVRQVLSLNSPGVEQAETAEQVSIAMESNDFVAEAVKKHPRRFAAFAALATADAGQSGRRAGPPGPATGLQRHADQRSHARALSGRQVLLADSWSVLKRSTSRLYLHPTVPPKAVVEVSFSGFSPPVTAMLVSAAWGWHIETAVHLIRMLLGWRVRPLSQAASHGRSPGRRHSVHVAETRPELCRRS